MRHIGLQIALIKKKSTHRHIIVKIPETQQKNKILQAVREKKQITYKGKPIRITADFSTQTIKARRAWSDIFQALKENSLQPRLMYPAKLSFKIDGEIRYFHDKEHLRNFVNTKPALQRILHNILGTDIEDHNPRKQSRMNPSGMTRN